MFYPTTKAMLDLANSLKALKAYQGLVSFPDLRPRGRRAPWVSGRGSSFWYNCRFNARGS